MIISHKHKFVLVAPPKTGSTAIRHAIVTCGLLGDDDVYSGIEPGKRDPADAPSFPDQGFTLPSLEALNEAAEVRTDDLPPMLPEHRHRRILINHATPTELMRLGLVSDDMLANFTVYALLRNPVEQYLSALFYQVPGLGDSPPAALTENVEKAIAENPLTRFLVFDQWRWHHFGGKRIAKALRFEHLDQDLDAFFKAHGSSTPALQRLKALSKPSGFRTDALSEESIRQIEMRKGRDLELWRRVTGSAFS
jgi:hypothetical protein